MPWLGPSPDDFGAEEFSSADRTSDPSANQSHDSDVAITSMNHTDQACYTVIYTTVLIRAPTVIPTASDDELFCPTMFRTYSRVVPITSLGDSTRSATPVDSLVSDPDTSLETYGQARAFSDRIRWLWRTDSSNPPPAIKDGQYNFNRFPTSASQAYTSELKTWFTLTKSKLIEDIWHDDDRSSSYDVRGLSIQEYRQAYPPLCHEETEPKEFDHVAYAQKLDRKYGSE